MKRYTVHFTDEAWATIQAQVRYIAIESQAPERASRWLARLLDTIDALEKLLKRHLVDKQQTAIHRMDVRRLVFDRKFLVFYTIDDARSHVNVVSFRHGAQRSE